MPVPEFPERLSERGIPIACVKLDPNNPRLSDGASEPTPEERIAEESVQRATLRRLNDGRFDMDGLRASIRRSGLLPLDRVVVRPIVGHDEDHVVVEGNRPIGAIKTLLEQHASGDVTLAPRVLATVEEPTVLVLEGEGAEAARRDQWVIQGIRHVTGIRHATGIREWGGYQVARAIQTMIDDLGYEQSDVADALGLTVHRVNRAMRVLRSLGQMAEDDEFGEYATPDIYAYFDDVIKRPKVRNWIGWDESGYVFNDDERARMLYSWISPDEELGDERRISVSGDVAASTRSPTASPR